MKILSTQKLFTQFKKETFFKGTLFVFEDDTELILNSENEVIDFSSSNPVTSIYLNMIK